MLQSLQVRDFAIVDDVSLELGSGLTALSGETGAGKSLLVDALTLAVGERASQDVIRQGAAAAEVNAVFAPPPAAVDWLAQHELSESDGSCMLRRVVAADGRSRAFINGRPVPVSRLKALGELLVDIHGQHAHQALLHSAAQREAVDDFGAHQSQLNTLRAQHAKLAELRARIAALGHGDDPADRADYLRYQISELEPFDEDGQRPQHILDEHKRLAHATELVASLAQVRDRLDDSPNSVDAGLGDAIRALEAASRLDAGLLESIDMLTQARSLVSEAGVAVWHRAQDLEAQPERLAQLDRLLANLQDLARKHRVEIEALPERLDELRQELDALEKAQGDLELLSVELEQAQSDYLQQARRLSGARKKAAQSLGKAVGEALAELGMGEARIEFEVEPDEQAEPSAHGIDRVRLVVATNAGQPMLPLARVASGGELSRIALAIQSVTSGGRGVPCVVFDEVDVGVGGAVAEVVGRRMRSIAQTKQVLTVTHQAQVAALAHTHVRVSKHAEAGRALTRLTLLDDAARIEEIGRMLGGITMTERTLEHAREMIETGRRDESASRPKKKRRSKSAANASNVHS